MTRILVSLAVGVVLAITTRAADCVAQPQDELGKKLDAIDRLRSGTSTPLGRIESESAMLLQDHTKPEEQGRIYYQVAHSYAQSGISRNGNAAKVIEYAQKALACPLDPELRLHAYVYWGDAIMASDRTRPTSLYRPAAARVFLAGLKEARQYNIPDVSPKRPPMFVPNAPMDEAEYARAKTAYFWEVQRVEKVRKLHFSRAVLENQLISSYTRPPYVPEELRKIAQEVLGDGPEVEKLVAELALRQGMSVKERGQRFMARVRESFP